MAKVKFYTDENVSRAVVMGLRRRGVDVLTVAEAGNLGASDEEIFRMARDAERVIFTQDDDFLRLAATASDHRGIVYTAQENTVGEIIRGLMLIHQVLEAEEMVGQVEFL